MRLGTAAGLAVEILTDTRVLIGVTLIVGDVRRGLASDFGRPDRRMGSLVAFVRHRELGILPVVSHRGIGDGAGRFVFLDVGPRSFAGQR